jgi:hypothetical protein
MNNRIPSFYLLALGLAIPSSIAAQSTSLQPPRRVWAAQIAPREISLVWRRASGAEGYRVLPVGSTPARGVPKGTLGKTVDHLSIPITPPFAPSYRYEIAATYAGGKLSRKVQSNVVVPVAAPPGAAGAPPAEVTASETSPGVVTVTWTKVPSATGYFIGRSVQPEGFKTLCQLCPTAARYVDRNVSAGSKHLYSVAAITPGGTTARTQSNAVTPAGTGTGDDGGGAGGDDSMGADSTDTPAVDTSGSVAADSSSNPKGALSLPEAPSGVKAAVVGPGEVRLDWDVGMSSRWIRIFRQLAGAADTLIAQVAGQSGSFIDHLAAGLSGRVGYALEAVNEKGASKRVTVSIEPEKARTDSAPAPKGLADVRAEMISPTSVAVTWKPFMSGLPAAVGMVLRVFRQVANGPLLMIASLDPTLGRFVDQLTQGSLAGGVRYVLEAFDGKGATERVTVSIDPQKSATDSAALPPKGVTDLKATVLSPTSIQLTYNTSPGATAFRILRRIGSGPLQLIATVGGTIGSFLDQLSAGLLQQGVGYAVEAINGKGASEQVSVSVNPQKAATDSTLNPKGPANPKAVRSLPLQIALTWGAVEGAVEYEIRRAIANGAFQIIARLGGGVAQFVDHLPPGTPTSSVIRYGITAINPKGRSFEAVVEAPPSKAAADTTSGEGIDSLPIGRGKNRTE